MQVNGALVKEQGITFGIIVVKPPVLDDQTKANEMSSFGRKLFGAVPIILAAQDSHGRFTYYGRPDIVKFLAKISASRIPWKTYTIN